MDSLLRWGLENSTLPPPSSSCPQPTAADKVDSAATSKADKPDSKFIDAILGPSDAEEMRRCLLSAEDESVSEGDRLTALDNFELLIESMDNAINIQQLGMYPRLINLAQGGASAKIRCMALWILGTAVQSNPSAQDAFLSFDPIPALLASLRDESASHEIRAKSLYCLSALLRHNPAAVSIFLSLSGCDVFPLLLIPAGEQGLKPDVRQKTLFLLHALLMQDKRESEAFEQTAMDERFKTDIDAHVRSKWTTDGEFLPALPAQVWELVKGDASEMAVQCLACALARGVKIDFSPQQIVALKAVVAQMTASDFAEGWTELQNL